MTSPSTNSTPEELQELLNGPAAPPPAGVLSNFDDPQTLDAVIIPILTLCLTLATLAVLARAYTKLFIIRSTAYEDYIILLSWVGLVGFTVPSVFDFTVGDGIHMWDVRLRDFFSRLYWFNVTAILYGVIVCLIKVSILLQYLRIFVPTRKGNMPLFVAIHFLIWAIVLFYSSGTGFDIFLCNPREKIWNPLMTTGHCFDTNILYQASGLFNIISDFLILILPMVPIWKLQLPLKKKILMMAIFATGLFACLTSILRTYYTSRIASSPDITYNVVIMGLWTWAEITAGLIISCLPVIPKFFQHVGPKVYQSLFSFSSKSESELALKPGSRDVENKIEVSVQFDRRLGEFKGGNASVETRCDSNSAGAQQRREYIVLDESDVGPSPPEKDSVSERIQALAQARATRRDDLESGHYAP